MLDPLLDLGLEGQTDIKAIFGVIREIWEWIVNHQIFLGVIITLILEENTHVLRIYIDIFKSECHDAAGNFQMVEQKKKCVCV